MGVKVTSPSGGTICTIPVSGFRYPGNTDQISNTSCGQIAISTPVTNSANGDHEIIVELQNIGAAIKARDMDIHLDR